ncbi:hypothetical protein JCM9533A_33180 [Catenuloplanes niger JCM 9533]
MRRCTAPTSATASHAGSAGTPTETSARTVAIAPSSAPVEPADRDAATFRGRPVPGLLRGDARPGGRATG